MSAGVPLGDCSPVLLVGIFASVFPIELSRSKTAIPILVNLSFWIGCLSIYDISFKCSAVHCLASEFSKSKILESKSKLKVEMLRGMFLTLIMWPLIAFFRSPLQVL